MSSVSAPGLPADQSVEQDRRWTSPILWGLRVAVLLAIFDALIGYQIPSDYYDRLARKISPLWTTYSDSAYTGQLILIGVSIVLAGVFAYILARRPIWQRWSSATQPADRICGVCDHEHCSALWRRIDSAGLPHRL